MGFFFYPLITFQMEGKCCTAGMLCKLLLIIGGLNWGLVGLGMLMTKNLNVVNMLLGSWPMAEAIVYLLVGLSAIWKLFSWNKCCGGKCSA